jgi:hypothetical protein
MSFISFRHFLYEGGNIKIGDVSAAPFKVTDRARQTSDIHDALGAIHDSFRAATGNHLFGKGKKALSTGSAFSGSTRDFFNKGITDNEYVKHKSTVGDVDVQVPKEHKDAIAQHLTPGSRFGRYTVVGVKKHGTEASAVMRHDNGEHHQFDFEGVHYGGDEPTKDEQFLHSSHWDDAKKGIKGVHHKMLINAAGGSENKFSITHGLRSRTDVNDPGVTAPESVSKKLFGADADHTKINSFVGVSDLIKKHIPKERHQEIYDKFKSGLKAAKGDHGPALAHLRTTLGVKDTVSEEKTDTGEAHTSVIPLVGFSPISHMGHAADLGSALNALPGTKHIGISKKADVFSPDERANILKKQWGKVDTNIHPVASAGETVKKAFDSLPSTRRRVLHLLVGSDRASFAEGLKASLEAGKIKEMGNDRFDDIQIHYPKDVKRTHGMSGTNMRAAAVRGDRATFAKHLGPMFKGDEIDNVMSRVKSGIDSGAIKLKR